MRRSYKHPPIHEALVEVQFSSGVTWDLTVPGRLHEALKSAYPEKPRQQNVMTARVVVAPGEQPATLSTALGLGKVLFPSADGKRLVGVGPDVLSIHILREYSGWEDFRPRVEQALREYRKATDASAAVRIGLRYINHVVLKEPSVQLSDYFLTAAQNVSGLPETTTGFVHRDEYRYDDGVQLVTTFASLPAAHDSSTFLLDVDVVAMQDPELPVDQVLDRVDDLHVREGNVFERLITDKLRSVFDAD